HRDAGRRVDRSLDRTQSYPTPFRKVERAPRHGVAANQRTESGAKSSVSCLSPEDGHKARGDAPTLRQLCQAPEARTRRASGDIRVGGVLPRAAVVAAELVAVRLVVEPLLVELRRVL